MDIKFQSVEERSFKKPHRSVRAFTYTDYRIDPHNHDFYEMNIILRGQGIHELGGVSLQVTRGDVFVIPPLTVHAYRNTEQLDVYHILFKKDFIGRNEAEAVKVPGFLKLMEIEPFLRQSRAGAMFLHLTPSQMLEIQGDLRCIEENGAYDDERLLPLHEHTALKLLYRLSYLLEKQTESEGAESKYRQQSLDTLEYLNSHLSERITLKELAARVYLSRSTLLRSFRSLCGCSPTEYLHRCRVKRAAELLAREDLSKTETAHACGFYDLSHMERSLKRLNG